MGAQHNNFQLNVIAGRSAAIEPYGMIPQHDVMTVASGDGTKSV
jgi:hypothetical protein